MCRSTAQPALCPAAASREAMDAAGSSSWGISVELHGAAPSPGGECGQGGWLSASCLQWDCPAARLLFKIVFLLTLNHLNKKIIQQKAGTCGVPPELPPSGDAFPFPSTLRSIYEPIFSL